jgi:hypothetical protein
MAEDLLLMQAKTIIVLSALFLGLAGAHVAYASEQPSATASQQNSTGGSLKHWLLRQMLTHTLICFFPGSQTPCTPSTGCLPTGLDGAFDDWSPNLINDPTSTNNDSGPNTPPGGGIVSFPLSPPDPTITPEPATLSMAILGGFFAAALTWRGNKRRLR